MRPRATTRSRAIVFNVLLIARAPLQLFQAIQTSLLPHLTGLEATEGHEAFARAIRITVLAIAAFAAAVTLGLLLVGPFAMRHVLFGQHFTYNRFGLALIGIGHGLSPDLRARSTRRRSRATARGAATACWAAGRSGLPRLDVRPGPSANSCCARRSAMPAQRCCSWRPHGALPPRAAAWRTAAH